MWPAAPQVYALQLGTAGGEENGDVTVLGKVKRRFRRTPPSAASAESNAASASPVRRE